MLTHGNRSHVRPGYMRLAIRAALRGFITTLSAGAALAATPALAQVAPATQETQQVSNNANTPAPAEEGQDIVVTGTLISNPSLVSVGPGQRGLR